jgi:hypothetical protein
MAKDSARLLSALPVRLLQANPVVISGSIPNPVVLFGIRVVCQPGYPMLNGQSRQTSPIPIPSYADHSIGQCKCDHVRPVSRSGLESDMVDVALHRSWGDEEFFGNFLS